MNSLCKLHYHRLAQGLGSDSLDVHKMNKRCFLFFFSSTALSRALTCYLLMPKLCQGRDELQSKLCLQEQDTVIDVHYIDVYLLSTTLANSSLPQNNPVS